MHRNSGGARSVSSTLSIFISCVAAVFATASASAATAGNFDARSELARQAPARAAVPDGQQAAIERFRGTVPGLMARTDEMTGATRSLSNPTGYLTGPASISADDDGSVKAFLSANAQLLGLESADLADYEVTDRVYSAATGATHLYLRQRHAGVPVFNGQLQLHVNRDGRLIGINNAFVPRLAASVNATRAALSAPAAVAAAMANIGRPLAGKARRSAPLSKAGVVRIDSEGISLRPIEATLFLLPVRNGETRLVWQFVVDTVDRQESYEFTVDATDGKVWTRFDRVLNDQYRVYPQPVESPIHTSPTPPSDGRVLVVDPADPVASPFGWHDTNGAPGPEFNITRGNNVYAYEDSNGSNSPPASDVDCGGSVNCDFTINLSQQPSNYRPAAVTNLFYWTNLIHDIQYQYGFDEPGGNFQDNTYGNGGLGNDEINAEAQDGSDINNARFFISSDGNSPRIEMYLWSGSPQIDGDLDNGIIVHEYGHGISTRQVGGPSNVSCLNNTQQPGEGWSDWLALAYTAEVGDQGTDGRGIGTYALDQPTSGLGIRTQRYSTDQGINNWTYASIGSGMSVPHGVGSVWAQAIWEAYWALVDIHGFDPDLHAAGGAGNQRMMLYVNEGLKNTACSPTFLDTRDGILQAATDNFGGADLCPLWEAFAAFGLGINASTSGPGSTNATNGFDFPAQCQCSPQATADAGPDQSLCLGDSAALGTPAQSGHTYSWAPGGETSAEITVTPSASTTFTLTASTSCGIATDSVVVTVDDESAQGLSDDFESGAGGWTSSGLWHLTANSGCASPGYGSPVNSFYYGQDSTCNYNTGGANTGDLLSPVIPGINADSTLSFNFYRIVEEFTGGSFDRAEVAILSNAGTTVTTLWSRDSTDTSAGAWQGSGDISLAAFAGDSIQIRFRFDSVDNQFNSFTGWLVDDVVVTAESACSPANQPPVASVTAPADGASFTEGDSVSFAGSASDTEDGDISASLAWTSSLDGAIGSGAGFALSSLSVGSHTISAAVTDSGGLSDSDSISITIEAGGGEPVTVTLTSIGADDGYVRETNENSGVGGGANSGNGGKRALRVGDNKKDRQYKSFVSFDTSLIPDGATITGATLRMKRGATSGSNPYGNFGNLNVDVQTGGFSGNTALEAQDFQASATAVGAATMSEALADNDWSEGSLDAAGLAAVNKAGTTQMRLYFDLDDNDNLTEDIIGYFPGNNGNANNHPQLVITYTD